MVYLLSDLHTKLKNARSSDGTTDNIGDIMLNWVGITIRFFTSSLLFHGCAIREMLERVEAVLDDDGLRHQTDSYKLFISM